MQVQYNLWYEPYGVVNKTAWPGPAQEGMFDTRFVGYGGDKQAWAHEAAMHGYQFRVHAGVFAVHMPEHVLKEHCLRLLPGFCHVAKLTPPMWGVGGLHEATSRVRNHLHFQFLDHLIHVAGWLASSGGGRDGGGGGPSESAMKQTQLKTRPCHLIPSTLYEKLSRDELSSLLFGRGHLSPGRKWNAQGNILMCARDSCAPTHPDLLIFKGIFWYRGALTDAHGVPPSQMSRIIVALFSRCSSWLTFENVGQAVGPDADTLSLVEWTSKHFQTVTRERERARSRAGGREGERARERERERAREFIGTILQDQSCVE
jgi:hypothetical protein